MKARKDEAAWGEVTCVHCATAAVASSLPLPVRQCAGHHIDEKNMNSIDAKRHTAVLAMVLGLTTGLTLPVASVFAQTAPAKPVAKPAAKPVTKTPTAASASEANSTSSLGNASVSSKLLTRDELRACFKQRDSLSARLTELDASREAMDKERATLTQVQAALKAERETLGGVKPAIDELNAKTKSFQAEVEGWQKRVAEFNEAKDFGAAAEKRRIEINLEGEALQTRSAQLQAERTALLTRGEETVRGFNARASVIDQRVAEWNERNRLLNTSLEDIRGERQTWGIECGERRYRDDDEKAILNGK